MIRLAEHQRRGAVVEGTLEGHLAQEDIAVLVQALARYQQEGVEELRLAVDGLLPLEPGACQALAQLLCRPGLRLCAASGFVRTLLASYGLEVEKGAQGVGAL